MTLEEKVAQLTSVWTGSSPRDPNVAPMQGELAEQRSGVAKTRIELPELAGLDVRTLRISDRVTAGPECHLARPGNAGNTGYPRRSRAAARIPYQPGRRSVGIPQNAARPAC
jgi:hypothetical protein